jgi:glycosyltransferase involved in cell wall biosynthesis
MIKKTTKQLDIIIFSWRGPKHPHFGGAEIVTHEYAKAWVEAGHNVTLFTSWYAGAKSEEMIDGVRVIRRGGQALGVQMRAFFWYLFSSHESYDLVFDHFHGLPFFTPLYIRVPTVGFIHEVAKEVWVLNPWPKPFNLIPAYLGTLIEPWIFKVIYRNIPFVTVSNSTKMDLMQWGMKQNMITVIPNGVVVEKISKNITKQSKKTAIFLGALAKDKGIEDAIQVFQKINTIDAGWQFWVVGKGDPGYLSSLKKQVKEYGLEKVVTFFGYVDQKQKFELLAKAHLMINPSYREGWGLVVIEAAAMKTPTIGYRVPGLVDSVLDQKTGILVEKGAIEKLADETVLLMNNAKKYQAMSEQALRWSKNFDWKVSKDRSLELISSFVSK